MAKRWASKKLFTSINIVFGITASEREKQQRYDRNVLKVIDFDDSNKTEVTPFCLANN